MSWLTADSGISCKRPPATPLVGLGGPGTPAVVQEEKKKREGKGPASRSPVDPSKVETISMDDGAQLLPRNLNAAFDTQDMH